MPGYLLLVARRCRPPQHNVRKCVIKVRVLHDLMFCHVRVTLSVVESRSFCWHCQAVVLHNLVLLIESNTFRSYIH